MRHAAHKRALLVGVLLALGGSVALPLRSQTSGDPTEPAVDAVRRTLDAARSTVDGEGTRNDKLAGLRDLSRSLFDTDTMGRNAMGDVLAQQPEASQIEFLELWDEFIVRAYLQKLLFFRKPRFGYGRSQARTEGVLVRTLIKTPKDDYYVDYLMRWEGEKGWQATDIIVESISLTHNHGEQFKSLLRTHSFEELLEKLRRKVARHRKTGDAE